MPLDEIEQIFGWVLALLLGLVTWLGKRAVNRMDRDISTLETRVEKIEGKDIMERPDVLTLYREQKEDMRVGFEQLRREQTEANARVESHLAQLSTQLNDIRNYLINRQRNERHDD